MTTVPGSKSFRVFFPNLTFFITGVKNVSIYEFSSNNFSTRPYIVVHILLFAFCHPYFSIRILSFAFFQPPFGPVYRDPGQKINKRA